MTNEFQRANTLILRLSEMQHDLQGKRESLENEIRAKQGTNDKALWEELFAVRHQIDTLYDEKLMLVQKMFNIG